jgi:Family of unknown function (DUF6521)
MKHLPIWEERPVTVAHLLNPAFCGEIIRRFATEYNKAKGLDMNLPYQLAFLVLPMVLHKTIRESLPKTTAKNFFTWIEENQSLKMTFPDLIRRTVPYTKESIMFLSMYKIIKFNKLGEIEVLEKSKSIKDINEVTECFKKADLIGKWLANAGSSQSIFTNLGIKP